MNVVDPVKVQLGFLEYIFGEQEGFLAIATADPDMTGFAQRFIEWPDSKHQLATVDTKDKHVWFCTSLLSAKRRVKANCLPGALVWSDLDAVAPEDVDPRPSVALESSPGRYQAFWRLDNEVPAEVAEDFSRRVAYANGADKTGWPLTKLLRMPFTFNYGGGNSKPAYNPPALVDFVKDFAVTDTRVPIGILDAVPAPDASQLNGTTPEMKSIPDMPLPEDVPEASQVIYAYRNKLVETGFFDLYSIEPTDNWSARLWRLERICAEVGMEPIEIFAVAMESACNKYNRDGRPPGYLWREVYKAYADTRTVTNVIEGTDFYVELAMPELVEDDSSLEEDSFIADYKKWAIDATDAPIIFHELSCFMALSALVCDKLRLETTFGSLPPNLWGLLLGESSLSRKTTAMKLAMNIVQEIDPDIIIATQTGSPEGLLSQLSLRPSRASVFFKDEVSGFFENIQKRDYLAGYAELLTELYDAPKVPITRPLRKETITVVEPYFVFFGGGIRDKVHSLITEEMIAGGFLPRFLVVAADVDMDSLRDVGPPSTESIELKQTVLDFFHGINAFYDQEVETVMETAVKGKPIIFKTKQRFEARLTTEAWDLWNTYEKKMVRVGANSHIAHLANPMFQRLAFSLLKLSMLVAVSRRTPDDDVLTVDAKDVKQAAWYIQRWGKHSVELISNANKPKLEKLLDKIFFYIQNHPMCMRSEVSQRFRLNKRDMSDVEDTLVMRGLVDKLQEGRVVKYKSNIG